VLKGETLIALGPPIFLDPFLDRKGGRPGRDRPSKTGLAFPKNSKRGDLFVARPIAAHDAVSLTGNALGLFHHCE